MIPPCVMVSCVELDALSKNCRGPVTPSTIPKLENEKSPEVAPTAFVVTVLDEKKQFLKIDPRATPVMLSVVFVVKLVL